MLPKCLINPYNTKINITFCYYSMANDNKINIDKNAIWVVGFILLTFFMFFFKVQIIERLRNLNIDFKDRFLGYVT